MTLMRFSLFDGSFVHSVSRLYPSCLLNTPFSDFSSSSLFTKDVCFLFSQIDVNIHNMTIQIPINQLASCLCSCKCEPPECHSKPPVIISGPPGCPDFSSSFIVSCVAFHIVSFPRMFDILNLSSGVSQTIPYTSYHLFPGVYNSMTSSSTTLSSRNTFN